MEHVSKRAIQGDLPKRLIDFFARFPPRLYGVHFTNEKIPTLREKIAKEGNKKLKTLAKPTLSQESPLAALVTLAEKASSEKTIQQPLQSQPSQTTETASPPREALLDPDTSNPMFDVDDQPPNPFLPYKNPATGRWRGAQISLRRQAELFKLARFYGVETLLPASTKSQAFKQARVLERGLAIKGTGEGQKVKGHAWERQMGPMLEKRIEAMEKMPALIREWRMRENGRKWKKFPR